MVGGFEYTHEDGTRHSVESIERAQALCPVLGQMALQDALMLAELSALGANKLREQEEHAQQAEDAPVDPFDTQDDLFAQKDLFPETQVESADVVDSTEPDTSDSAPARPPAKEPQPKAPLAPLVKPFVKESKAESEPVKAAPLTSLVVQDPAPTPPVKRANHEVKQVSEKVTDTPIEQPIAPLTVTVPTVEILTPAIIEPEQEATPEPIINTPEVETIPVAPQHETEIIETPEEPVAPLTPEIQNEVPTPPIERFKETIEALTLPVLAPVKEKLEALPEEKKAPVEAQVETIIEAIEMLVAVEETKADQLFVTLAEDTIEHEIDLLFELLDIPREEVDAQAVRKALHDTTRRQNEEAPLEEALIAGNDLGTYEQKTTQAHSTIATTLTAIEHSFGRLIGKIALLSTAHPQVRELSS